jgi:PAS domain S-box-containing protein
MPHNRKEYAKLQKKIKSLRLRIAELEKDKSQHKQAEEPQQKSDLLYQILMKNINLGITFIDPEYRIVMTNAGQGKMFHKPHSEFVGKYCFREFEKRVAVCPHCPGTRAMATKRPAEVETEGVLDDGSRTPAHLRAFPVLEADGSIKGFVEVVEDISEYKRAEEKLRESENKYKTLLENLPQKIFLKGRYSTYVSCNANYANDLNIKPDEITGKTDYDFYPKKLAEKYRADDRRILNSGKTEDIEEKYIKDGQEMFVHTVKTPVRDEHGNIVGLLGIFWDITEQKKIEESLRTSEAQLSNAMKIAKLGYWEYDVADNLFTFNDRFYSIFRTTAKQVGGYKMSPAQYAKQFLHPDDVYMVEEEIKKAIKTTDPHFSRLVEHRIVYADGEIGYMTVRHFVVKDKKGRTVKTFGANQDITDYKKVEEELRQAQAKYRTLVEQIPAVTYISALDKTSTTIYVSPQIQQFLGFSQQEYNIDHDLWLKQLHPDDRKRVLEAVCQSQRSKKPLMCEYRMLRKDGGVVWFRDEAAIVCENSGKPQVMQGVMFDITAQKQAEEELNTYRERMARAERLASLGTLSATLAHELTQPLTVIRLSLENSLEDLKAKSCPKSIIETLKDGLNEVSNATSVIDRFRNFARQSSRKTLCEINVGAIAERIVLLLSKTAQRVKMNLRLRDMNKLPAVYSNEKDIEQLFFALTENAIQAADGKKSHRLTIEGAVKDKNIELRFSDNCCGIAPENLNRIFDPFFTTGSKDGRTGLGLPIVQRILSGYGGNISVRSRLGKGTTFYVTLPIHSPAGVRRTKMVE